MLILSCPPASITLPSPDLIELYARATEASPEPQTWFIVVLVVSFESPARIDACLAGFCPAPVVKLDPYRPCQLLLV